MKKILTLVLSLLILASFTPAAFAAGNSLANFSTQREYDSRFEDVSETDWYYDSVILAYELGLINGESATSFAPQRGVTTAEVLVIVSNLHKIFTDGEADFEQAAPWYKVYADYAEENSFLPEGDIIFSSAATRKEVAVILANALPPLAFTPINSIEGNSIPDVKIGDDGADAIYTLYRAGILSGVTADGAFYPDKNVSRAEMAAIAAKVADPSTRSRKTLKNPDAAILTSVEIAEKCTPAVFLIELYSEEYDLMYSEYYGWDEEEPGTTPFSTGSGFFISSDGVAVTNYHVIEDADRAVVVTTDGERHDVEGVYSIDLDTDLAIIKVSGTGFATLELGDSNAIRQGERVYIIGSPLGLDNTFAEGVISNTGRDINDDGMLYIQAAITATYGSSGGALVNSKGQVIGVLSAGYPYVSINFSVPINALADLERISLGSFTEEPPLPFFPGCRQIPDFSVFSGVEPSELEVRSDGSITAEYSVSDFSDKDDFISAVDGYISLLIGNGMDIQSGEDDETLVFVGETESLVISGDDDQEGITLTTVVEPVYYENNDIILNMGWFFGLPDFKFDWYEEEYYEPDEEYVNSDEVMYLYGYTGIYNFNLLSNAILTYYAPTLEAAGFELVDVENYAFIGVCWYTFESEDGQTIEIILSSDRFIENFVGILFY